MIGAVSKTVVPLTRNPGFESLPLRREENFTLGDPAVNGTVSSEPKAHPPLAENPTSSAEKEISHFWQPKLFRSSTRYPLT